MNQMNQRLFSNTPTECVLYYFEEISGIPRASGREQEISNTLLAWAESLGLEAVQDAKYNLIIKKAASAGAELAEPIILQAHMDMVCEKNADSAHDFCKDGIRLRREGDLLLSADGTTLGADDGLGVAYCMALLASEDINHPPLEVILTTEEETTFGGVCELNMEQLAGRRLINLDHAVEHEVVAGSCGGTGIHLQIPVNQISWQKTGGWSWYKISISGLQGGHSGDDIHLGRGSAIQLLARMLRSFHGDFSGWLVDIEGGTNRLAISREAAVSLLVPNQEEDTFLQWVKEWQAIFKKEYAVTAPNLSVLSQKCGDRAEQVYTKESLEEMVLALTLFPDGIQQMNGAAPGVVESSLNVGCLSLDEKIFTMTAEIRGAYGTTVTAVREKIECLAKLLGGTTKSFAAYDAWECTSVSPLRQLAQETYRELFGEELQVKIIHAGLECGILAAKRPGLDVISLGPNCWYFHSPMEQTSISSVEKVWKFLCRMLEQM